MPLLALTTSGTAVVSLADGDDKPNSQLNLDHLPPSLVSDNEIATTVISIPAASPFGTLLHDFERVFSERR